MPRIARLDTAARRKNSRKAGLPTGNPGYLIS